MCLVEDNSIIIETGLISAYFSYQCVQWRITVSLLKLVLSQRIFLAVCPVEDNCIIIETGLISLYFLSVCLVDDICVIIETGLISAYFSYQCVQWRISVS